MKRLVTLGLTTISVLLAASAANAQRSTSTAQATEPSGGIEEVVVTARKREESLLDVPVAITAITGEELAAKGITNFNQLADAVPGINLTNIAAGAGRSDRSFQAITLRGVVPSTALSTLTSTFIDGVPVASPTAVASVNDPARIEILKGSQAAYFGRNTFAGALNVVNKLPAEEFGGFVRLSGGSHSNSDAQASVEGHLGEKFGFRLGGHYFDKSGSYKNAAIPSQTLGDQQTRTITGLFTAKFTENFSGKVFLLYSKDHDGAPAQGLASAYELRANNGAVNIPRFSGNSTGTVIIPSLSNCDVKGLSRGLSATLSATELQVTRPWICGEIPGINHLYSPAQNNVPASLLARSLADPSHRAVSPSQGTKGYGLVREYQHAHVNLDYQFGESGFTLSSLTGLNAEYWSEVADLDNYDTSLIANPSNPAGANAARLPYWDFVFGVERETYDFSQEFRLSYDKQGPFSGVLGVSYLPTTVWNNLTNIAFETQSQLPRPALTSVTKSYVRNKAAFFGTAYKFTDKFRLNVEGRYQQDYVVGRASSVGASVGAAAATQFGITGGTVNPVTGAHVYAPDSKIIDKNYNAFLPRIIAQYDLNPDVMAYASYSKGVNVGTNTFNTTFLGLSTIGINAAVALGLSVVQKPEKITNYELGLKGKFLDGRLTVQSALYQSLWKDQLNNFGGLFIETATGTPVVTQVGGLRNTGDAKLRGLEVELEARPIPNLTLNLAAALTKSSIKSYFFPEVSKISGVIGDGFRGNQLPGSSKHSLNFGAQYGSAIESWKDGRWFARADFSWKDKQFVDASNINWIAARSIVNLRAGISRGPLSLEAYVLNALNDDNYVGSAPQNVLTPNFALTGAYSYINLSLPELRTFGATLKYKF